MLGGLSLCSFYCRLSVWTFPPIPRCQQAPRTRQQQESGQSASARAEFGTCWDTPALFLAWSFCSLCGAHGILLSLQEPHVPRVSTLHADLMPVPVRLAASSVRVPGAMGQVIRSSAFQTQEVFLKSDFTNIFLMLRILGSQCHITRGVLREGQGFAGVEAFLQTH